MKQTERLLDEGYTLGDPFIWACSNKPKNGIDVSKIYNLISKNNNWQTDHYIINRMENFDWYFIAKDWLIKKITKEDVLVLSSKYRKLAEKTKKRVQSEPLRRIHEF